MPLDRPILITGTPRSGKSILREIISAAPEFLCVEEPLLVWNPGGPARDDDRLTAADATPEVCARIRADCEGMLLKSGRQRYLDDLAYHALRIPFVLQVIPEARIIHIVRGPEIAIPELVYGWTYKDTVSQMVSRRWRNLRLRGLSHAALRFLKNYITSRTHGRRATWGPMPPGIHEFAKGRSVPEVAAFQWRRLVEIAMEDLALCPPEQSLLVRFEGLLANPKRELRRIIAFVEPQDPEAVLHRGMKLVDPDFHWDGKVQPSPREWKRIDTIIAPLRQRLRTHGPHSAPAHPAGDPR